MSTGETAVAAGRGSPAGQSCLNAPNECNFRLSCSTIAHTDPTLNEKIRVITSTYENPEVGTEPAIKLSLCPGFRHQLRNRLVITVKAVSLFEAEPKTGSRDIL